MRSGLKIGELAKRAACQVETVRFYEREGLLTAPLRSGGNYRLYGEEHLERLLFIRQCRSLDMTLDEIRALLKFRDAPEKNCDEVNALLDAHIGHVADRIAELKALQQQLNTLRRLCGETQATRNCGILKELSNGVAESSRTKHSGKGAHLHGMHACRKVKQ
jgi:Cd(II)/Pb(II)-responsive transcriptional regulator